MLCKTMEAQNPYTKFNHLPLDSKATLVTGYGHFLLSFVLDRITVALYEIEGEFVVVYYDSNVQQVTHIWMLTYLDMDEFVEYIDIESLLNV
jgi:hypothetical protein